MHSCNTTGTAGGLCLVSPECCSIHFLPPASTETPALLTRSHEPLHSAAWWASSILLSVYILLFRPGGLYYVVVTNPLQLSRGFKATKFLSPAHAAYVTGVGSVLCLVQTLGSRLLEQPLRSLPGGHGQDEGLGKTAHQPFSGLPLLHASRHGLNCGLTGTGGCRS